MLVAEGTFLALGGLAGSMPLTLRQVVSSAEHDDLDKIDRSIDPR